jgi:hypothetical protein
MKHYMNASEWLERLADALDVSHAAPTNHCVESDCSREIFRGIRCESCRKKRHAASERARMARRNGKDVKAPTSLAQLESIIETF